MYALLSCIPYHFGHNISMFDCQRNSRQRNSRDIAVVYLVQTFKNEGRHYKSTIETDQQFIQHCYRLDYGMHNLL